MIDCCLQDHAQAQAEARVPWTCPCTCHAQIREVCPGSEQPNQGAEYRPLLSGSFGKLSYGQCSECEEKVLLEDIKGGTYLMRHFRMVDVQADDESVESGA